MRSRATVPKTAARTSDTCRRRPPRERPRCGGAGCLGQEGLLGDAGELQRRRAAEERTALRKARVVAEVVGLELGKEVPEEVVVRPDLVVRQLVQQRVHQGRVRLEAAQVHRPEPHVDGHPVVGVVAEQPLAAALHLLGEPVVDRVHLGERPDPIPTLPHDAHHRRVGSQPQQQLARLEGVRGGRRGASAEALPRARLESAELVLCILRGAPHAHLVCATRRVGCTPRSRLVLGCKTTHRRV
mmetsp:Transcript_24916/g.73904  ORF Transcript_24916/g.73904 Transcript_24916/m.73904 type:complete len:242 (+) Transcript_24916:434-1159(+)